mmetsp:Transcript_32745/g.55212  ORF Transcript_32745/g.55212 Transcript_32745/m.55212 type:complete len:447 (-) Transcript_32745:216-1556(-)|eukprot:CAMPEP_0174960976 /NCGR_PEP_ID=MMETSP0004_2-20121128/3988_1 /TAXON_ID=420556 /ORGANISM="Ochromonas sp., Strain CCMP1393" /LENGTH=446 /DNA_ID=CAMNT_0016209379 /DNA_START=53 /DNA_END=1393 /DNA_ORIENTATION=-
MATVGKEHNSEKGDAHGPTSNTTLSPDPKSSSAADLGVSPCPPLDVSIKSNITNRSKEADGEVAGSSSSSENGVQEEDAETADADSTPTPLTDRYGFLKDDEFHQYLEIPVGMLADRKRKEGERAKKWVKMMKNWSKYRKGGQKYEKMKNRVRKGIPDAVRGVMWYRLCGADEASKALHPDIDAIDTNSVPAQVIDEIGRDIDRTFPLHELFLSEGSPGQVTLLRLLIRYAALDPAVGYCQGMGFIAAMLLTYMVEEDAFHIFYTVMFRPTAPLRLFYLPRLAETQKVLWVFGALGARYLGNLWSHLDAQMIHPSMYFTEWCMTVFARGFNFDLVTRVWDVLINEGTYKVVYRVSLALLKYCEKALLGMGFENIMGFLRELPGHIDALQVMELAWSLPVKAGDIEHCEQLYEQQQIDAAKQARLKATSDRINSKKGALANSTSSSK